MSGKGSKPRPFSVNNETFSSNWDNIFNKNKKDLAYESDNPLERPYEPSQFWSHFCKIDKTEISTETGKACNWCGEYEDGSLD